MVTIIVLLILAGITISSLTGENGIFNNAKKAKRETEIAQAEEDANMIYLSKFIDRKTRSDSDVSLSDIVSEMNAKGYEIKSVASDSSGITGITLDNSTLTIGAGKTSTIKVNFLGSSGNVSYYAHIDGKDYLMTVVNGKVTISREATELGNTGGDKLSAEVSTGTTVTIGTIGSDSITVNAGSTSGSSTIKVTYGSFSQECNATVVVMPTETSTADANTTITNDHGTIDVIWLEGKTNTVTSTPNAPVMKDGMSKVTWTKSGDNWTEDKTANSNWYSYTAGTETTDNTESRWANAKNSDGSYFVWIPRYAYRITYYDSSSNVSGFYDGYGMWDINGKLKYSLDSGIETVEYNGNKYIVHPAFCDGSDPKINYANGQWNANLQGFWVAKYEMSRNNASDTSSGSGTTFACKPGVQSARTITIGNMYTYAKAYDTTKNSHLMKNSEWGAVAYLTHSQYGRNGNEIDINNSSSYITGNGGGSTNASSSSDTVKTYAYNTTTGAKASSTGNIYGIYDLSGGAWEYVSCFDGKSSSSYMSNGQSMTDGLEKDATTSVYKSNNFVTVYTNGESDYNSTAKVFSVGRVGDATKEVRKDSTNWFSDYSEVVSSGNPFLLRGGSYGLGSVAGAFYAYCYVGDSSGGYSFRAVLAPL